MNCKNCGAELFENNAVDGVVECEYCFSRYPVPKKGLSPAAYEFLRIGEHELDVGRFDEAYSAYEKAAGLDPEEPEAQFGMALARFKVQYLRDEVNNRLQAICNEITDKKFQNDSRYLSALSHATEAQREEYRKRAEEIDYIRSEFYDLKNSGIDFDCFLCVKVTGADGEKTEDSKDADYIYDLLKDAGFKPFYSERNIRNRTGADYEAMILYALRAAETMLVICREEEYLQTPWVKNEYTRFLRLVNDEEKESDALSIVYYEKPIERLSGKRGKIQGIDFSRRDSDRKICEFVKNHTEEARALKRKEDEEKRKTETPAAASNADNYLKRGRQELEARDWNAAKHYFDTALNEAPENGEAWLGLFFAARGVSDAREFARFPLSPEEAEEVYADKNFTRARQYATGETAEKVKTVEHYLDGITEKARREREAREEAIARFSQRATVNNGRLVKYNGNDEEIVVPENVTEIGEGVFRGKVNLRYIELPEGLKKIGKSAFEGCVNLSKIVMPEYTRIIGQYAFKNCVSLTEIRLGGGEVVADNAFSDCPALVVYCISTGEMASLDLRSFVAAPIVYNCKSNDVANGGYIYAILNGIRYRLKDGTAQVARQPKNLSGAFKIPNQVTYRGKNYAVTKICGSAFSGCDGLTELSVNVSKVGWSAFVGCDALSRVTIGAGADGFPLGELNVCKKLERVEVDEKNAAFASQDGIVYNKNKTIFQMIPLAIKGEVTLPDSLLLIPQNIFANCAGIIYQKYGNAEYLGDGTNPFAFLIRAKNRNIASCEIHQDTKMIAANAFEGCVKLTRVALPAQIKSVGANVFAHCAKELQIDCAAPSRPDGWNSNFDKKGRLFAGRYKVNWGIK